MSRLGVQNIFEFLADENDDNKAKAQPRKVVAADDKKAAAPKPKPVGDKPAKPVGDRPARPPKDDKPKASGDAQQRPPRAPREPREPREPRPPRDNANRPPRQSGPRNDAPAAAAPAGAAPAEANLEEKPGSQVGRRGDRPPRQAGDRDKSNTRQFKDRVRHENPNQRFFERKSGTGRSEKENKKGGSGKANWGKEGEEAKDLLEENPAPEANQAEVQDEKKEGDEAAADAAEQPQQPPAKPTLGLDEYQAKKQQERAGLETLLNDFKKKEGKERKVNEEQSWDGFKVLKRDDEDAKATQAKKEKAKKEKKAPTILPVNFSAPEAKPLKGKGKGKAPGEGKPSAPATPDVTSKDAFPALRAAPTPVATSS